jgi:hypothetical protein
MTWVTTGTGTALIGVALVDVFQTLWHPGGRGRLSRAVGRAVWRVSQLPRVVARRWCAGRSRCGGATAEILVAYAADHARLRI